MKNIKQFINDSFENKESFIGHNPMASYVMMTIFIVTFCIIITGAFTFGIQEGKGIFSALNHTFLKDLELFEELHEFFANLLYGLIVLHLIGIAVDKILHKETQTLNSIFTGYKNTQEKITIKLTIFQKIFFLIMALLILLFIVYNIYNPSNILLH